MASKKELAAAESGPLQPGTKGIEIAFGDPENTWTYDLDEQGGVINLMPTADNPNAVSADMIDAPPEEQS